LRKWNCFLLALRLQRAMFLQDFIN
jgi:hypothetical protein